MSPPPPGSTDRDLERLVRLDGLTLRRMRHERGWSPRDLIGAVEAASWSAQGLRRTLTPNQIQAIEERAERVPYAELLLLADGLDCDPVDLLEPAGGSRARRRTASENADGADPDPTSLRERLRRT